MVARPLVEEVKRGEEDQLGILDGGQVELEHVVSTKDPWVKEEQTNDTGSGETPAFLSSSFHTQSVLFFLRDVTKKVKSAVFTASTAQMCG